MHVAAAEEFSLELSDWQDEAQAFVLEVMRPNYERLTQDGRPHDRYDATLRYPFEIRDDQGRFTHATRRTAHGKLRRALRDMYDRTQAQLATLPADSVRLYRGVLVDITDRGALVAGEVTDLVNNSLESWTAMQAIADGFRTVAHSKAPFGSDRAYQAVTIAMDIPKNRILATAKSGFGCLDEWEFVVLGGTHTADESLVLAVEPPVGYAPKWR
jgi:hypothetical protein